MTIETTHDEVVEQVEKIVASEGMTLAEFVEAGKSDELTDGNLRDLWIVVKGILLKGAVGHVATAG